ncbi:DUF1801 domain-containing protein [Zavarzinia compransoris]|uniref:DUF1801 domain-containing protein n=1 Tax=Zavarzinia marina TaxID=2911065 RepID=UPI001F2142AE|nr:DUF1801 domain-containing protein [Zavarzinia marina]MCF4167347.1 DUF1801 domain-containing protein [Zavarzinia marina]
MARAFDAFPAAVRRRLLDMRALIFETAAGNPSVGPLTETLRWGEPAYLAEATGSGTTIRLGMTKGSPPQCAMFVNCRTTLIDAFRLSFPDAFGYEKNRAVLLPPSGPLPREALAVCVAMALTYRRRATAKGAFPPCAT